MANCFLRLLTWNVVIVSIGMFALGVANITVTTTNSLIPVNGSGLSWLFTQASVVFFLAVGIWASIPCLLSGIGTLRSLSKPDAGRNWLWATLLSSAFFFTPLLVLFSAFNATSMMAFINTAQSANMAVPTSLTVAFALPLTIAILAGLVHLHFLLILCINCQMGNEQVQVVEVAKVVQAPAPPPTFPEPVLRSTAWHVSAPAATHYNYQHYGQPAYGR